MTPDQTDPDPVTRAVASAESIAAAFQALAETMAMTVDGVRRIFALLDIDEPLVPLPTPVPNRAARRRAGRPQKPLRGVAVSKKGPCPRHGTVGMRGGTCTVCARGWLH